MVLIQEIVFERNEMLIGIFLIIVLLFYLFIRKRLTNFPHRIYFELSLFSFFWSKILTIVEDFFWNEFFNILEHLCLLLFTIFLTIWIIKMNFEQTKVEEK